QVSIIQLLMPNTSLLRLRQRLLYETLRERYFDPTLGDATRSLLPRSGTAKLRATLRATRRSVQVNTSAQCPMNK
ncbi:MAG: hypothetical protein ACYTX0_51155, partial [Nostoc sp.]